MDRKHKLDIGDIGEKKSRQPSDHGNSNNDINPWTGRSYSARYHSILDSRIKLPVYAFKDELIDVVKKNQIVIVEGETGSGE
jgi:pre-mRNA-splicing factor ATP-dependent RNA helicase DHX15/PRP43